MVLEWREVSRWWVIPGWWRCSFKEKFTINIARQALKNENKTIVIQSINQSIPFIKGWCVTILHLWGWGRGTDSSSIPKVSGNGLWEGVDVCAAGQCAPSWVRDSFARWMHWWFVSPARLVNSCPQMVQGILQVLNVWGMKSASMRFFFSKLKSVLMEANEAAAKHVQSQIRKK